MGTDETNSRETQIEHLVRKPAWAVTEPVDDARDGGVIGWGSPVGVPTLAVVTDPHSTVGTRVTTGAIEKTGDVA